MEGSGAGSGQIITAQDPDPGGLKTYGSGTLNKMTLFVHFLVPNIASKVFLQEHLFS
jgi:hypothetical protein